MLDRSGSNPQLLAWAGESNSGITLIPLEVALAIISTTSYLVYTSVES